MNHTDIINYLVEKNNFKSYLEIGVGNGENFNNINIQYKECCDITNEHLAYDISINYIMTSNEMFDNMHISKKFDLIFIDGLHLEKQVDKDIINSLKHLKKNGLILIHDILPGNEKGSINYFDVEYNSCWSGTVYKSICKLNAEDIEFYTVDDDDFGLAIIKYCEDPYKLNIDKYDCNQTYSKLFKNNDNYINMLSHNYTDYGKYVLHIISEDEFLNIF